MGTFIYTALENNRKISGELSAGDAQAALMELSRKGLTPLHVQEKGKPAASAAPSKKNAPSLFGKRVGYKHITAFTRQFATLLASNLPLIRALDFLRDQYQGSPLAGVIDSVAANVREGQPLSRSLADHPRLFDRLYVSLVAAGEAGGLLGEAVDRLAFMREAQEDLRGKVKGALIYPAIMFVAMVGAVITMMLVVVPRFAGMFADMGQSLPWATQALLDISHGLQKFWWAFPIVLFVVLPAWKKYGSTPEGRMRIDSAKLRIPAVGPIVSQVSMARWCRTLGTLIGSGVPLLTALQSSAGVTGNMALTKAVEASIGEVREGKKLADTLKTSGMFPRYVTEMISMGEESGSLDAMLGKVADHYEREVDQLVKNLTAMLEPIMILFMGGVVGFIVMAMLLPVFQMQLMAG
jgi:type II secretory pathway component PulF